MPNSLVKSDDNTIDEVSCMLLPLKDKQLLVPNVSVAEIVPFSHLLTTASSKNWMLGRIQWRGITLPVVCYEMLNQQTAPAPNPNARFAIINGVGGHHGLPFYALLIQGIPRQQRIQESDLQTVEAMHKGAYDAQAVTIGQDESAMIPDLDSIEEALLNIL